jgi:pimeloyl-ACP methyl ester carboxylesterase
MEPRRVPFMSQRLRLNTVDWGNEDAPPLILVHGARDHARAWDDVARSLSAQFHVIAPDLRGHGDSQWADAGGYHVINFVYDLAELIHQLRFPQVTLIGHSLGGNIALRFAGLYPEKIGKLVCIEGLGPSPGAAQKLAATPIETRLQGWVDEQRKLASHTPRGYATLEEAIARMQAQNPHLGASQARHLTVHGVRQNDDTSYAWKFDPYLRSWPPVDLSRSEIIELWGRISCAVLLVYGGASWASNPATDGRVGNFRDARVALIEGAGHWVHHDRPDEFIGTVRSFLSGSGA